MKHLISAAIALTLLGSPTAFAQTDYQNHQGGNPGSRQDNGDHGDHQNLYHRNRDFPHWSRGDRLSPEYRGDQYVVSDWRDNHLRQPPRGYHWVRRDNQYILVAITSGLVLDAILNSR
jgi:Ni/Co efflux regulator RcnB